MTEIEGLRARLAACDGRDYGHFERQVARDAIAALERALARVEELEAVVRQFMALTDAPDRYVAEIAAEAGKAAPIARAVIAARKAIEAGHEAR